MYYVCIDCEQKFPTNGERDDHVIAARHWDDDEPEQEDAGE